MGTDLNQRSLDTSQHIIDLDLAIFDLVQVPRQHSSGDKRLLMGISKRGDRHLRTLLITAPGPWSVSSNERPTRSVSGSTGCASGAA
ncbi:MAG TPA: hypothetical protein DIU10_01560 [Sulfitobacter sp.]|nr:hypothetical protein [Sulfitobacter sp.]